MLPKGVSMTSLRPFGPASRGPGLLVDLVIALLLAAFLLAVNPRAAARAESTFPQAAPESVGLSSAALSELADVVQDYVDREMVVGAELLVIKDRQTVLHEAFGLRDREAGIPMERDTLFNIRSMSKPLTGAAAQVLIDDGRLALDDRAADYLPGFDNEASGQITIEQLLTHRSGLPLTAVQSVDQYPSLREMADAIGTGGPQFEPGSRFWYSDAGVDALGAIVEQASGESLDAFVAARLLEPLGMTDTYHAGDPDDARLDRVASLYVGRVGEWTRFWGPQDEPFYPYPWGSQSLYGTPADYARFLTMWMDAGRAGDEQVLSPAAVERTLTPVAAMGSLGSDAPYPTLYPELSAYHGQLALLHLPSGPIDGAPPADVPAEIIGYSGSDGTIAWAWPERDLMILYFTQSRGGSTPIRLEGEIERLLLHPREGPTPEIPVAYGELLGTYTADFGPFRNEPFEIAWRDGELALDVPSQFVFGLDRAGASEERWSLRGVPGAAITVVRDDAGAVSGLRLEQGGQTFELPRGTPAPEVELTFQPETVARYLGRYGEDGSERVVEVALDDGRLGLLVPESAEPLALFPPDADGVWRLRLNPAVEIRFEEEDGAVVGYRVSGPGGEATFRRLDD